MGVGHENICIHPPVSELLYLHSCLLVDLIHIEDYGWRVVPWWGADSVTCFILISRIGASWVAILIFLASLMCRMIKVTPIIYSHSLFSETRKNGGGCLLPLGSGQGYSVLKLNLILPFPDTIANSWSLSVIEGYFVLSLMVLLRPLGPCSME